MTTFKHDGWKFVLNHIIQTAPPPSALPHKNVREIEQHCRARKQGTCAIMKCHRSNGRGTFCIIIQDGCYVPAEETSSNSRWLLCTC